MHGNESSRRAQRGVALLVAILLVALGTIVAAAMAYNNAMTARRAAATFEFDQALLVAEGAEAVAAYGLHQTFKDNPPRIYPGQYWSQRVPPSEATPGVTVEASLEDLQGRFNINDLVQGDGDSPNRVAITAFQRLLSNLNLDPNLADYVVDWIDKNNTPMPDGAEDSVYMEMNPSYRPADTPITSTSELLAVQGFTRAIFDKLAPYIVALPIGVQVNTCSAPLYVINALLPGGTVFSSDPEQFEKDREAKGDCYPTKADVLSVAHNVQGGSPTPLAPSPNGSPNAGTPETLTDLIDDKSRWFRLTSFVDAGSAEFAVYTTLYVDQAGLARPVMRSFTPD
jgi:general secretion pathway protein K